MKKPKPFKKKDMSFGCLVPYDTSESPPYGVFCKMIFLNEKDCRRMSAWLLKAADWIEFKNEETK